MRASALAKCKRPAPRVVVLEPSAFADTYGGKPAESVAVGLRTISDSEEQEARRFGDEAAEALQLDRQASQLAVIDERNDATMAALVGAALCSPNDVTRDPEVLELPRAMVRVALTSRAVRHLYEELELLAADVSPASREATDDELLDLSDLLTEPTGLTRRARRLLAAALDELTD